MNGGKTENLSRLIATKEKKRSPGHFTASGNGSRNPSENGERISQGGESDEKINENREEGWMPDMREASEEEARRQVAERETREKKEQHTRDIPSGEEVTSERELETDEQAITKFKKIPTMPTQKEIDEHMISHIPSRIWCEFC